MSGSDLYYYSDSNGISRGPYTLEKLFALQREGLITLSTLVKKEGEDGWRILEGRMPSPALLSPGCSSISGERNCVDSGARCPNCRSSFVETEERCNVCCPECGFILRAESDSFCGVLEKARKQVWCFEGRSTRKELMGVFAVVFLVQVALVSLALLTGIEGSATVCLVGELVVSSTLLPVAVRRLNDAGRSPAWLWSNVVLTVLGLAFLIWKIAGAVELLNQFSYPFYVECFSDSFRPDVLSAGRVEKGFELLGYLVLLELGAVIFVLVKVFMDVILLVQLMSPSVPGDNEHGPCPEVKK